MIGLINNLKNTPIFADFSTPELEKIAVNFSIRHFKKGQIIFKEGDFAEAFYIIKTGKVKVSRLSSEGREFILGIFKEGSTFGDVPVFDNGPYPATATALEQLEVYTIDKNILFDVIKSQPDLSIKIINMLGKRLRQAHNVASDLGLKNVTQRLATLLIKLSSEFGVDSDYTIKSSLTRQEMAELIGVSRETLIRELSKFVKLQLIEIHAHKIRITDKTKLELLSKS